jgi:predicted acylesterase/phospholipase RssA
MSTHSPELEGRARPDECDLVMKGGITSGIVYPPLVIKLHEAGYRFRSIGGTSAGAIAAAVTAAAEYGRDSGGFKKLNTVNEQLRQPGFVKNLFQPTGNTRPLMETLLELAAYNEKEGKRLAKLSTFRKIVAYALQASKILPRTDPQAFRSGSIIGLICAVLLGLTLSLIACVIFYFLATRGLNVGKGDALRASLLGLVLLSLIFSAIFAWFGYKIGGLAKGIHDLYVTITERVLTNFFVMCNGRKGKGAAATGQEEHEVLTDWLSLKIQELANLGPDDMPLTFGDLWWPEQFRQEQRIDPQQEKRIDLRMMTSNLSQNQPYVMPFARDLFLFKETDFETLFPENIVRHMVGKSRKCQGFSLPEGYHFLPEAKDLPVIVATRMSLSFPLLISMVPLYTISHDAFERRVQFDFVEVEGRECIVLKRASADDQWLESQEVKAIGKEHLQHNWFSDGGICSNFPMHFFDSWLPTRPTFGVNLTSQLARGNPEDPSSIKKEVRRHSSYAVQQASVTPGVKPEETGAYNKDVYLPKPDSDPSPEWIPISDLGKFLGSIFTTAQNYRDNMQAMLPSYRERIVQIRLSDEEGGLNLDMPTEVVKNVFRKGEDAGEALKGFNFEHHQWVRFRVLMKKMEESLVKMNKVMSENRTYLDLVEKKIDTSTYPYPSDLEWLTKVAERLISISGQIKGWSPPDLFAQKPSPLPEPILRVTPEV